MKLYTSYNNFFYLSMTFWTFKNLDITSNFKWIVDEFRKWQNPKRGKNTMILRVVVYSFFVIVKTQQKSKYEVNI